MKDTKPEDALYVAMAAKGMSNRAIAKICDVDEATVRRGLKRIDYKRYLVPLDLDDRFAYNLNRPIVVEDPSVAITADWHVPLYDPTYVNYFIETARARGARTLIAAGDFFNFDALSRFDPKQEDAGLEFELSEATAVMRVLLESFDRIVYLWGNHDGRLTKALGFAIQFKEAMKLVFGSLGQEALEILEFSNLDHCWLKQGDGREWYVCHPENYNRNPLTTARVLASKFNANVITAHSHHCAIGYGTDGKKVIAEVGGLFDKDKTAYLQKTTTHPTWQQGFAILEKDMPILIDSPGFHTPGG